MRRPDRGEVERRARITYTARSCTPFGQSERPSPATCPRTTTESRTVSAGAARPVQDRKGFGLDAIARAQHAPASVAARGDPSRDRRTRARPPHLRAGAADGSADFLPHRSRRHRRERANGSGRSGSAHRRSAARGDGAALQRALVREEARSPGLMEALRVSRGRVGGVRPHETPRRRRRRVRSNPRPQCALASGTPRAVDRHDAVYKVSTSRQEFLRRRMRAGAPGRIRTCDPSLRRRPL